MVGGDSAKLIADVRPANASNSSIRWSSGDTSITIVENGKVIPVGVGKTTITATSVDNGKTAVCTVTVLPCTGKFGSLKELSTAKSIDQHKIPSVTDQ